MSVDPYAHIEEAFGLDENPFPAEGISSGSDTERYSEQVFPEETREFRMKVIRGGLQGGRKTGFLWSMSPIGEDTGFGKTTMMRATVHAINGDFGDSVQESLGIKSERRKKIVGAFAELNEQLRNGLYPVLFAATQNMASGRDAVLGTAREVLLERANGDVEQAWDLVTDAQLKLAPSGQALRPDLLEAFFQGPSELAEMLADVSDAARLRNGVQYFTGALYILAGAGVEKVFLMLDQLEDLGKKGALTAAKRRREIGRIRDLLEIEPFASRLHMSFTFHEAAASNLEGDWYANRLPSFDHGGANSAAAVVLRGLRDDDQVEELLKVWMEPKRNEHAGPSPISPFTQDVRGVLLSVSQGRPGILLNRGNELIWAGAEAQVGEIDGAFAREHFRGGGQLATVATDVDDVGPADDYDDLLR
jgi:hypothetical protein